MCMCPSFRLTTLADDSSVYDMSEAPVSISHVHHWNVELQTSNRTVTTFIGLVQRVWKTYTRGMIASRLQPRSVVALLLQDSSQSCCIVVVDPDILQRTFNFSHPRLCVYLCVASLKMYTVVVPV